MIVKIYAGEDGKSHFEDVDASRWPPEWSIRVADADLNFRSRDPGYFYDWHNESRRQYVITLSGQVDAMIGDGTVRRFGPGGVMIAVDLTGQGHTTRTVGDVPWVYMSLPTE